MCYTSVMSSVWAVGYVSVGVHLVQLARFPNFFCTYVCLWECCIEVV